MQDIFILLIGLQIKHFAADYLLQNNWMIAGKRSVFALGGYAHAGVHAAGTAVVLLPMGLPLGSVAAIIISEFFVHYGLDFAKARFDTQKRGEEDPKRFWAKHGLDQMLHQLTYVAIAYAVVSVSA
ncbi:MAG: DUF3307 domain-containing protein [Pseudomonadota bacterium]